MNKRIRSIYQKRGFTRDQGRQRARRDLGLEALEDRVLLVSPRLVAIHPNAGELLQPGRVLDEAPDNLLLRFNVNQAIDPQTLGGIRVLASDGDDDFENGNIRINPGFIGIGEELNEVIIRFRETLPDDLYQIHIIGSGTDALRNQAGDAYDDDPNTAGLQDLRFNFRLDLGAQVTAVVPQPVNRSAGSLTQARNQIVVYFNDDDLNPDLARNPAFYQLIDTNETTTNQDDSSPITPVSVAYDADEDRAILSFGRDLDQLGSGSGTFRLRIGNREPIPSPPVRSEVIVDPGSSYDSAHDLGLLAGRGKVIASSIEPQLWRVVLPGSNDDPGTREIPYRDEQHVRLSPDNTDGITTIAYNFRNELGADDNGNPFFNFITEEQKQRAREAFELWSHYSGVEFIESETSGITIGFGDLRAIIPEETGGRDDGTIFATSTDPFFENGIVILDIAEQWDDAFGDNTNPAEHSFFRTVLAGIGHLVGLGNSTNLPGNTILSNTVDFNTEVLFPGPHDVTHIQHIHRPDSIDVDLYRFDIQEPGVVTIETAAERLTESSLLDTTLSLFRQDMDGARTLIARNDDYFSNDSFIRFSVEPGTYYVGVSSTGNSDYNPSFENSGAGGTTQGDYELRLDFARQVENVLRDQTGTAFDGDADGRPNGVFNFWFRAAPEANTIFVDKSAQGGGNGSRTAPYRQIGQALSAAQPGDIVRIVGNGGLDGDLSTVNDNDAYLIGFNLLGRPLEDGTTLSVPQGVTVMVDAGAVFKMNASAIQVGSSSPEVDRSKAALQILGTPQQEVFFTSYNDEDIGNDANPELATLPVPGDWGGVTFRNDVDQAAGRFDFEREGVFLNYIAHADMRYGGGMVVIDSVQQVVTPVDMTNARPTVIDSTISRSADAAMSANPDSFEETTFNAPDLQTVPFTSDYSRIGPELHGNIMVNNSTNGLFVQIQTPAGEEQQEMTVSGRWDDTDVTHVVAENLIIRGQPGGPLGTQISGNRNIPVTDRFILSSRLDASLVIDPGIVVKLDAARIETGIGAQLIAEGSPNRNIIFTSIDDDRYGAGGTFDARSDGLSTQPAPGDWAGIYFGHVSAGSLDNVFVAFAGGITKIEGTFTGFNAVEIHQADVRITNSVFDDNADGIGGQAPGNRLGRGANAPGAIFVLGAQPVIVDNIFRDTLGGSGNPGQPIVAPGISVDINSLNHLLVRDWGKSTGSINTISDYQDNHGALVRRNEYINNSTNGMVVRGGTLTTQGVWDDTEVVHVVLDEIMVPDFDHFGGLRLESSPTESLVVKFFGPTAGIVATGQPLDINDRIGGSVNIVGQPGNPVILTSLADDSVGAGFISDTNNDGFSFPVAGDWQGITIDQYANDRNVTVYTERELPTAISPGANDTPGTAEPVGNLAPAENAGDDNRRLGFEIHGFLNQSADIDVYSFAADPGTEVWVDIDRTSAGLDTVVELVNSNGVVLASSDNSAEEAASILGPPDERLGNLVGRARIMDVTNTLTGDLYSSNQFDAGMRVALPGSPGQTGTFHIIVRSSDFTAGSGGNSSGVYQLQLRLREVDEVPGNSVTLADITYANHGISVLGQPAHSPLLGEFAETSGDNDTLANAQNLGNLLVSERDVVAVSGRLDSIDDVDWYQIEVQYEQVTRLFPDEAVSVTFDIDYADGLGRPDTMISVFRPTGELVLTSTNAGVADDLPKPSAGGDTADLSRGSVGVSDPTIGPVQLLPGTYYVAISGGTMPAAFDQFDQRDAGDTLARFEPLDSINRIGEDHADAFTTATFTTAEQPQIPIVFGEEFALVVPEDVSIREGETISVESLAGQKVTFEFDSEGFLLIPPNPSELVDGETISIRSIPFFFGATSQLETFRLARQGFVIDITAPNRLVDGEGFFVQGPNNTFFQFEFDNNFLTSGFSVPIFFSPGQTADVIAANVANAINSTGVLTATVNGSQIEFGNATGVFPVLPSEAYDVIEPEAGDANLVFYNEDQTQEELARNLAAVINSTGIATATVEGLHSFRIRVADVQDVLLSRGGGMVATQPVRAGNFPISYTAADDADTIGFAIANAIDAAMGGFGISAFSSFTGGTGNSVEISITDRSIRPPTIGTGGIGGTLFLDQNPIVGLSPGSELSIIRPGFVPYTLQDVTLYVVEGIGLTDNTRSHLATYDAYTGAQETIVGPFGEVVGDVAMRPEGRGEIYSLTYTNGDGDRTDDATGLTIRLSETNGASTQLGDDGVGTFVVGMDPMSAEKPNDGSGWGINYQAMTFIAGNRFVAVGSRYDGFIDPTAADLAANPFILQGNEYRTNLVFLFDEGGAVRSNGDPRTGTNGPEYLGGGTDLRELGHIDTFNDVGGTTGTILMGVPATDTTFGGFGDVTDGMQLEFNDGAGRVTFEFESGPEVQLAADPTFGQSVRDGELFIVDGTRYTFDTGGVIVVEAGGVGFSEGDTITIIDDAEQVQVFELDSDGSIGEDSSPIPFDDVTTQFTMINRIVSAINAADFRVQATALGNRISLVNDTSVTAASTGARSVGQSGIASGVPLPVEEFYTNQQIGDVIVDVFKSISPITASQAGDRLNFLGANAADFSGASLLIDTGARTGLSDANAIPVEFLASDDANIMAARVMNAVNQNTMSVAQQLTNGTVSILTPGSAFTSTDSPIQIGGAPVGGTITGIVRVPDDPVTGLSGNLYLAVSDTGGLYEFDAQTGNSRYVATATDLVGIPFAGLTLGPEEIEFGRYATTMFGIDELGNLHAFDLLGQSLPVFANGDSTVSTNAIDPVGLEFGTLQESLWSTVADVNRFRPGHGVEIPVTDSRLEEADSGNSSFHFGVNSDDIADRNYNFPGGAHGTMISNTFSLADYTAADQPMLYFNYLLLTEDAVYNPNANPPQPMRDSFRVYIMDDRLDGDRGEWYLLATNNQYRNDNDFDEFDDMDIDDGIRLEVQELHDNTDGFRQARVSLAEFAGRENLRLRFEFASAGGVSLGNDDFGFGFGGIVGTGGTFQFVGSGGSEGTELYAVPGDRLRDGHQFSLGFYGSGFFSSSETFEFDLGYTLVPPSGERLPDGETFTLVGNAGAVVTYEFDKDGVVSDGNVPVDVRDTMSSSDVAASIDQALASSDLGQPSVGAGNFTGNLQFEANDTLALALDTGLNPRSTGVFTATGLIGDNQAIGSTDDIDIVKFDLDVGDSVQVRMPVANTDIALRLFNDQGIELATDSGGFFGATPSLDFTASLAGTYYVGVSDSFNTLYDPLVGSDPTFSAPNTGVVGDYQIQVTAGGSRLTAHLIGNRLNIQGLASVIQDTDPQLFVDGAPGTQSSFTTPVQIHSGMNEIEVASAIEQALADAYSQGDTSWVIRRDEMIKIGGRDVTDPGPLGMSDHLWGDFTSAFNFSWAERGYSAGPFKGLDNEHEGAYIDDIVIGFAERGEMVTEAAVDSTYIPRTDITDETIVTGPYQLEIREASQYGIPDSDHPNLILLRGFDTNERLSGAVRLDTPSGADLSTGQTFAIGDGAGEVTFEYADRTIAEGNDTLATAEPSNLVGGQAGTYIGIGEIGDNSAFGGDNNNFIVGTDVDFIELDLQEDDLVVVDVDAYNPDDVDTFASTLDSAILVFDESGNVLAISDNDLGPGDLFVRPDFLDPAVTFRAPSTGKYYIGISQSQNTNYSPNIAGSGAAPFRFSDFRNPEVEPVDELPPPPVVTGGTYEVKIDLNGGRVETGNTSIPFATFDSQADVANRVARAINDPKSQAVIDFTAEPLGQGGTVDLHGDNIVVTAVATSLAPESNDTIADAVATNTVIGRSSRFRATGRIGDNPNFVDTPGLDVDIFRVELEFGGLLIVDVDAFDVGSRLRAGVTVIDDEGNPLASTRTDENAFRDPFDFNNQDPLVPLDRQIGEFDPVLEFRAPETGTYYVAISANSNIIPTGFFSNRGIASFDPLVAGSGTLNSPFYNTGTYTALIQVGDGSIGVEINDLYGDSNITREQGQLILDSNRILHSAGYGIRVDAGARDNQGIPHPGPVRNLPDINVKRLVPGVTITNNIVARSGLGGILFSGDAGGDQAGAVPVGRIVNNTLYGSEIVDAMNPTRNTIGIEVNENASPTLLNNIVAEFGTGIFIDSLTSNSTVVGGTLYRNNDIDALAPNSTGLGDFPIQVGGFRPLFEDAVLNNFYLVDGSIAIDSSVDSLADRVDLINIRDTLGIPVSPILAPDFDNAGQLRVDDPNVQTPAGQGENVFKDRGALDRADFSGPRAILVNPLDNDPAGEDANPDEGTVFVPSAVLRNFVIELIDNTGNGGVGVDDDTVSASVVSLRRDGVLLTEGEDYRFEYSRTNDQIRLSPISGIWPPNSSFEIDFNNRAVQDLAGNNLSPNELDGDTVFFVSTDLGRDFGDAQAPYPTSLANDGARHQLIEGFFLGTGVDAETDSNGADDLDDGIVFGSSFVAGLTAEITVNASDSGFVDAWIDWNFDGDWNDVDERVLSKREVSTGVNSFEVRSPEFTPLGNTFARFRLSSLGDLEPTGFAPDGEVEDYQVEVTTNPWRNPRDPLDIDDLDGPTPLDALFVINELNDFVYADSTNGRLPIPSMTDDAPFFDANGDGFVSPLDALLVINSLPTTANASAAPLGMRAEVAASNTGPVASTIDVSQAMAVDLRPTRNNDQLWAALAPTTSVETGDGDASVPVPAQVKRRFQSHVDRRSGNGATANVTTHNTLWTELVDDVFDEDVDTFDNWEI